jgi:Domain of unknown function (DUF4431)
MRSLLAVLAAICTPGIALTSAGAACVNLKQTSNLSFEGMLSYHIFAGPPNYQDVRKGDTPEPTYTVRLDTATCATGDDFLNPNERFDRIQVYPAESDAAGQALGRELRRLVGKRVSVEGKSAFGAHTGHHHAPLLLPIIKIAIAYDATQAYGTAMTTVQAFYLALGAANGEEASKFLVPEKRSSGPLSARAITNFYGRLVEPLALINVLPISSNEYRVRYSYVASGAGRCNGESVVRTTTVNGLNLIESIRALNEC